MGEFTQDELDAMEAMGQSILDQFAGSRAEIALEVLARVVTIHFASHTIIGASTAQAVDTARIFGLALPDLVEREIPSLSLVDEPVG